MAKLREAGAVFLGKTVTTEFASFDPPPTRNPVEPDAHAGRLEQWFGRGVSPWACASRPWARKPADRSRAPAAYCGVAGCKPTYGRASLAGILPLSFHLDHPGPIAHDVADLAIMLTAIAGYDPQDPISIYVPPVNFTAEPLRETPPRLAVLTGFFSEAAAPDVRESIETAIAALASAGATIDRDRTARQFCPGDRPPSPRHGHRCRHAPPQQFSRAPRRVRPVHRGPDGRGAGNVARRLRRSPRPPASASRATWSCNWPVTMLWWRLSHDDDGAGLETTGDPRFQAPFSYAGLPTVCFPCGLSSVDQMPVSLQLIGGRWAEGPLLSVGPVVRGRDRLFRPSRRSSPKAPRSDGICSESRDIHTFVRSSYC